MKLNGKDILREQTVMVYKPTGETFYGDAVDSGCRTYLSLVGTGLPCFFGRKRTQVRNPRVHGHLVFSIPIEHIPEEYLPYNPHGEQEFDTHDDMEFLNKYIEVIKVFVTITKENI